MIELTANEARALGVLVEKAMTTPDQYPLSINALTAGCNQKNNRDPVLELSEEDVFTAVEGLREKQFAVRVDAVGSRVHKYRHEAERVLGIGGPSLAILAELLLRGPQTIGELRGRASRMSAIETLEEAQTRLRALIERPEPLVKEFPPAPGSRAGTYAQLLSPAEQPLPPVTGAAPIHAGSSSASAGGLSERVAQLEREVATLRAALQQLAVAVGEPDPLAGTPPAAPESP